MTPPDWDVFFPHFETFLNGTSRVAFANPSFGPAGPKGITFSGLIATSLCKYLGYGDQQPVFTCRLCWYTIEVFVDADSGAFGQSIMLTSPSSLLYIVYFFIASLPSFNRLSSTGNYLLLVFEELARSERCHCCLLLTICLLIDEARWSTSSKHSTTLNMPVTLEAYCLEATWLLSTSFCISRTYAQWHVSREVTCS